jgi:hypothetical protein
MRFSQAAGCGPFAAPRRSVFIAETILATRPNL